MSIFHRQSKKDAAALTMPETPETERLFEQLASVQAHYDLIDQAAKREKKEFEDRQKAKIAALNNQEVAILLQLKAIHDTLPKGTKKTIEVPGGVFGKRQIPLSIEIAEGAEESIIKWLYGMKWHLFLRAVRSIKLDLQAMKKYPETAGRIPGVSFVRRVDFLAKPSKTQREAVLQGKPLKWQPPAK